MNCAARSVLGVEIGQRRVKQDYRQFAHKGPAHGRALARLAVQRRLQLQLLGGLLHLYIDLGLRDPCDLEPLSHVLTHRHMRIEQVRDTIAISRSIGAWSLGRSPPMRTSPDESVSRPDTMRSKVDVQQPDVPTITINSPS